MTLVMPGDIGVTLRRVVDVTAEANAIRLAEGWLLDATGLSPWPEPVPDDLWAWALELAVIAYQNPESKTSETTGPFSSTWAARRAEILVAARSRYGANTRPVSGVFPSALPWPDPAWCR